MALLGLWLRRLAYERTAALALVALLFVTALAVALAPRVLEQQATSALTRELAAASSIERALVIHETAGTRARPATDFAGLTSAAADLAAGFPGEVAALVRDRRVVVDTAYWQVHAGPAISALIRLRVHDGAFEQLEFITGRPPTEAVETVADERPTAAAGQRATVYEAAMPASAAAMLDVGVGDVLPLETWRGDPTNLAINLGALVRIVGTYEAVDRDADFWINDTTALGWRWFSVGTNDYLDTSALLHPAAYDALVAATHDAGMTLHFQYRYLTDTDRLAAEGVPATIGSLRRLAGAVPRTGISDVASDTRLNSGLLRLLERHQLSWQSVMALLSLIGLGVLTIAAATLAAVTLVASAGRVRVARLLRARGAAGRQVLGSTAAEMALLATPAALAGLAIALALLPGPAPAPAVALAAFVAFLAVVVAVGVVSRAAAGGPAGRLLRGRRPGARRLMLESSLVAGALGGAWLLRERGISALAAGGGAELIVAAVLALVGLAAGIICVRIYPLPVRLLGGLVALRRDLLPVLAVRRATRGGSSAALLFLLVATATVGAFASAALVHLDRSAELGAWHAVGADQRISAAAGMAILPAGLDADSLPGVAASSAGSLRQFQVGNANAWLVVIEPASHERVVGGTPADTSLPAALSAPAGGGPLPVVAGGLGGAGSTLQARLDRTALELRVVRADGTFPGVPIGDPFVVVAGEQLAAAGRTLPADFVLLRTPARNDAALSAAVARIDPSLTLESRAARAEQARTSPQMGALRTLLAAGAALAIGYAVIAAAAALALAGAAQRDEVAHLRALGLSRRGHAWLTLAEYGPAALIGYVAGVALGLGLFAFLLPALGLASITGSALAIPASVDPGQLAGLLAAMLAILVIGWLAGVLAQRDTNPATAIRRGVD